MPGPARSIEKWRIVENVVAAIERTVRSGEGWKVIQNAGVRKRTSERRRQVDVFLERPGGARIGIDVKAERRPLDIEAVEQLCCKLRKLELDFYVIVSTSGFTEQALEEAREEGVLARRLDELNVSEILKMEVISRRTADVSAVEISFPAGADRPPGEQLLSSKIITDEGSIAVVELAKAHAVASMQSREDAKEGETSVITVNRPPSWKSLLAGGKEWVAPLKLDVTWTLRVQRFPGQLFRNEQGQQIFTAIVPSNGWWQQLTLVTLPNTDGSFRVSVSLGELRSPRRNV
jgi:Restriction endonuclease